MFLTLWSLQLCVCDHDNFKLKNTPIPPGHRSTRLIPMGKSGAWVFRASYARPIQTGTAPALCALHRKPGGVLALAGIFILPAGTVDIDASRLDADDTFSSAVEPEVDWDSGVRVQLP